MLSLDAIHRFSVSASGLLHPDFFLSRALEDALLGTCSLVIPETLIVEQAREKFAIMMTEFKDQGESDEKIQSMITKEVSAGVAAVEPALFLVIDRGSAVVFAFPKLVSVASRFASSNPPHSGASSAR